MAPDDYVDIALTTLMFDIGETTKTVDVTVIGDELDEGDEEFLVVNLSNPSVGASISKGQGVGTIQDDDAPVACTCPTWTRLPRPLLEANGTRR